MREQLPVYYYAEASERATDRDHCSSEGRRNQGGRGRKGRSATSQARYDEGPMVLAG